MHDITTDTAAELRRRCKAYATELEAYAEGRAYLGEDGEARIADGEPPEGAETLSLCDWLDDAYDIKATIDAGGRVCGVRVAVALGGPSIYVDTEERAVMGYWGTDRAECCIHPDPCSDLDCAVAETMAGVTVRAW